MIHFFRGNVLEYFRPGIVQFDHLITDPPYSEHTHGSAVSCAANSPEGRGAESRELGFDHLTPELREYLGETAASVRRWSILYSDDRGMNSLADAGVSAGAQFIRTMPWVRWSMPCLFADRPPQGWEPLVLLHAAVRPEWYGPGWLTHFEHRCLRGRAKHKTEKPLDQSLDLVSFFTKPGELVYDPCGGRAGLGLACRVLGRRYIGCELDAGHHEIGAERLVQPVGWYGCDRARFETWCVASEARVEKCREVIAHDEHLKASKLRRLSEKGAPAEDIAKAARRDVAVQAKRCLAATIRDLDLARTCG
jgi:hypothetical protein